VILVLKIRISFNNLQNQLILVLKIRLLLNGKKTGSWDPGSHDFCRVKLGKIEKVRKNTFVGKVFRKLRKNTKKLEKY